VYQGTGTGMDYGTGTWYQVLCTRQHLLCDQHSPMSIVWFYQVSVYQTTDRTFHFNIHPGIRTPWDILVSRVFQLYSI